METSEEILSRVIIQREPICVRDMEDYGDARVREAMEEEHKPIDVQTLRKQVAQEVREQG